MEQTAGEKFAKTAGMFIVGTVAIGIGWAILSLLLTLLIIGVVMLYLTPIIAPIGGIIVAVKYRAADNCPQCKLFKLEPAG